MSWDNLEPRTKALVIVAVIAYIVWGTKKYG